MLYKLNNLLAGLPLSLGRSLPETSSCGFGLLDLRFKTGLVEDSAEILLISVAQVSVVNLNSAETKINIEVVSELSQVGNSFNKSLNS